MGWNNSVVRITGPEPERKYYGTGFIVGAREGNELFVVTNWHVVKASGGQQLHVKKQVASVVSADGDDTLDLAVLRLPATPAGSDLKPLALSGGGRQKQRVEIFGYGAESAQREGRSLRGRLDALTYCYHPTDSDVRRWDFYLVEDTSDAYRRIQNGYSGSPVCDQDNGQVVAVATNAAHSNDKGYAIHIGELPRVYAPAAAWLDAADDRGEYHTDPGEPLVKLLDRRDQLKLIERLCRTGGSHLVLVEAGVTDWPEYLADRLYLDPCPDDLASAHQRQDLNIDPDRDDGFRAALIAKTPRTAECADPAAQLERVRRWVNDRGRLVCYACLDVAGDGRRLRRVLHDARTTLAAIGALRPGASLLVFIVIHRDDRPAPVWRRWFAQRTVPLIPGVTQLPALGRLRDDDIMHWHDRFPPNHRSHYDRGALKQALLDLLLRAPAGQICFHDARRCLIGDPPGTGALSRARRKPP